MKNTPKQPVKQSSGSATKFVIWIISLGIIGMSLGAMLMRYEIGRMHVHEAANKVIVIKQGAKTDAIISTLYEEGVLEYEWPMRWWLRTAARGQIFKAGSYTFKSPISPREIIAKLVKGNVTGRSITIPEGFNMYDIAHRLAELDGLKDKQSVADEDVLELLRDTSLIKEIDPKAKTLEGYLFPDTYEFTASTTRESLIDSMVKRFKKVYTPQLQKRARQMGMTNREIITLASLIEKEARVDDEREYISQVYHSRLKEDWLLACDPTVIYAALIENKYRGKIYKSDLERKSPYNTYKVKGLPPGPIASPGKRSIEAALNPADTKFMFFVVDGKKNNGSHKFSETSKQHEAAVAEYRRFEASQR